ncbi:MAG: hypothetical protein FJ143_13215, partial [Deltaproteobacteria bacterium]|nr:hypothetical protein [Deltaproteobacteria bacterium]
RFGRIVPAIIAVAFILDVALRFLPLDHFSFRAWEAMLRFRGLCGPFRSDTSYDRESTYGDLAAMANLPEARQYRREVFTTDSFGYRQNQVSKNHDRPYRILLLGDSMGVGSGVSDHQTLTAQLERQLDVGTYNAAAPDIAFVQANHIVALARRLKITEGTVMFQYLGRVPLPTQQDVSGNTLDTCGLWPRVALSYFSDFVRVSPLEIISQHTHKRLHNDVIFPNSYKDNVVKKTLTNGERMLFYPPDLNDYRRPRDLQVHGVKQLAERLASHRLRLVAVLTPDKYTVYEPLLKDADHRGRTEGNYLDRVEAALREADIPVINLTGFLQQKARELYARNTYIYWHDDVHWNALGIEIAAQEIVRHKLIQ